MANTVRMFLGNEQLEVVERNVHIMESMGWARVVGLPKDVAPEAAEAFAVGIPETEPTGDETEIDEPLTLEEATAAESDEPEADEPEADEPEASPRGRRTRKN